MKEREANRKYQVELFSAMLAYLLVLTGSIALAKPMEPGAMRTLLLLTPVIPLGLSIWAIARHGFLESAGFPRLSMFWVWGVMGLMWGLHSCLRCVFSR